MKVRITKAKNGHWYQSNIGEVFEVEGKVDAAGYYVLANKSRNGIRKEDCEIIEEPKEIPIKPFHNVQNPQHYHSGGMDLFTYAEANYSYEELAGAYRFNVEKYLLRFKKKNGLEDLEKAETYLKRLIQVTRERKSADEANV